jgi:hypothetical protein
MGLSITHIHKCLDFLAHVGWREILENLKIHCVTLDGVSLEPKTISMGVQYIIPVSLGPIKTEEYMGWLMKIIN